MITQAKIELSPQQLQILCLSWDGLTVKAIAERMGLSDRTVKNYRSHIYKKFGVHNVEGMLRQGVEHGYLGTTYQMQQEWP